MDERPLRDALQADWEAFPDLRKPRTEFSAGPRLLEAWMALFPDEAAVRAWLEAQIVASSRQYIGTPRQCLGPRFSEAIDECDAEIPEPTRSNLRELCALTRIEPVPVVHHDQLAKALTVRGAFRDWLMGYEPETKQGEHRASSKKERSEEAYRLLAQRLHPDMGGDAELMAALNELRRGA